MIIRGCDHNLPLIGGNGQLAEIEYATDFFDVTESEKYASAGIGRAYENRDEIEENILAKRWENVYMIRLSKDNTDDVYTSLYIEKAYAIEK